MDIKFVEDKNSFFDIFTILNKNMKLELVTHPFEPFYTSKSKILLLGTIPSLASRKHKFYYAHPQNRFWKVLTRVFLESIVPQTIKEKKDFLVRHGIALWDVLARCEIQGASDSTIKNPTPNDFSILMKKTKISHLFTIGNKAFMLYKHFELFCQTKIQSIPLPSTSSANVYFSFEQLVRAYQVIAEIL